MDLIHPHSVHDVREALRAASRDGTRVLCVGGRTHIDKGNGSEIDAELWTTLLDEVVSYDPAELITVVEAGMRAGDLRALLAEGGQEWAVDAADQATVGGLIAAGVEPVRRLRVGSMRDSVVEMEAVTGDGRLVRSGARTVKNVTGYDVHRLLTGSLGTLGCIVQVALKVRPLPKAVRTLETAEGGIELARRLLDAVPLPAAVLAEPDRVVVRLEGWPKEVEEQKAAARSVAGIREADPEAFPGEPFPAARSVLEAAVPPSKLGELVDGLAMWRASLGVGTAWIPAEDERQIEEIRARASSLGGIAPAIRGPGGLGNAPLAAPTVHRRIKDAMDPAGVLAPGRSWGGI